MMFTQTEAMRRPHPDEYFEYYHNYISQVPAGDLLVLLERQIHDLRSVFDSVSEQQALMVHPPYTWSLKQVVGHLIDGERIFAFRLHHFASGDVQPLPGMDQDPYVANQDYVGPSLKALVDELIFCRQANVLLMRRLKPESWDRRGIASDHPITVRALAYILVGHINHHMKIVRKRLGLKEAPPS